MLKKFCAHVGCHEIVPATETYCVRHRRDSRSRQTAYDAAIRKTKDARYYTFYHSPAWVHMQAHIMDKYHGICLYSYFIEHKIVKADAVHHIIELREDWDKRLDIKNLIPLSGSVHDGAIRQMYRKNKKIAQAELFVLLEKWNKEFRA